MAGCRASWSTISFHTPGYKYLYILCFTNHIPYKIKGTVIWWASSTLHSPWMDWWRFLYLNIMKVLIALFKKKNWNIPVHCLQYIHHLFPISKLYLVHTPCYMPTYSVSIINPKPSITVTSLQIEQGQVSILNSLIKLYNIWLQIPYPHLFAQHP